MLVVCAETSLRKAAGDKPSVSEAITTITIASNNNNILHTDTKSKKVITVIGSGKYDLKSNEYRKKVIKEGLLD